MDNTLNKKRVGTITFHRAINYGALLQAYALQTVIKKKGFLCDIIDYRSPCMETRHRRQSLLQWRNPKDVARYFAYHTKYNAKFDKFRSFLESRISISEPAYNTEDLIHITKSYDALFTGSDQVWNYKITNCDSAYLLDFVEDDSKKKAYAASLGIESIPKEFSWYYRKHLSSFDKISVREPQGNALLKSILNKDSDVVLDPTLLLTPSEWEEVAADYSKLDHYILIYSFGLSSQMRQFAEKLSRSTGLRVVILSYSLRNRMKAVYEGTAGPEEFVGLFKKARYVLTNSFHGMAFCINFGKDFFFEMLPDWHEINVNSRLINMREFFGLHSREIRNGENLQMLEPIDYDRINASLEKERSKSLAFLESALEP